MGTQALLIFFGVTVQLCNVSGKNSFYEYYYSRYHKSHSTTTESTLSSISDIFSSLEHDKEFSVTDYIPWEKAKDRTSTSDDNSLQNNLYEVTDDSSLENHKYEPTGGRHRFHPLFLSRTLLIVGSIVAFLVIIGVIVCCCPKFCRGSEYRSNTRRNNVEPAAEVLPQQPVFVPYPGQQAAGQHLPVQYPQEQSLPEYQPRIMQWAEGQHLPVQHPQGRYPPEYQPQIVSSQPQCVSGQHFPHQNPQGNFPPDYQPQVVRQQPQCCSGQHFCQHHSQELFLPDHQPHVANQQPQCFHGQHSYNLPEAPPPYEFHIK